MSSDAFEVDLRFNEAPSTPAQPLRYAMKKPDRTQRRFEGRVVLEPEIDPADYTVKAVVDWVELAIETARPTQAMHLSGALAGPGLRPWATGPGGEERYSGHNFVVTLQEPNAGALRATLDRAAHKFGLVSTPRIVGVEISIDWRPKDGSDQSRWLMTALMHRHFLPDAQ